MNMNKAIASAAEGAKKQPVSADTPPRTATGAQRR